MVQPRDKDFKRGGYRESEKNLNAMNRKKVQELTKQAEEMKQDHAKAVARIKLVENNVSDIYAELKPI